MKVIVITECPHEKGTSALLADKFIEGSNEAYELGKNIK
jgi:hypothetical protein